MVQYAEIKEVESVIKDFEHNIINVENTITALEFLKKYHTILEGWYGDEQYHII